MFWHKMNANASFNAAIERLWITPFSIKFSDKVIGKRVLKMNEAKGINQITVNLPKEKVDFINERYIITKICTSWWKLLWNLWIAV